MRGLVTIAVVGLAVLAFANAALAGDDLAEEAVATADWEDAIEYAGLVGGFKDDDGAEWATYWDEEQGLMWSQPVGAADEDVLDALAAGGSGGSLDWICVVIWPIPFYLAIYDDASNYAEMYYSSGDFSYAGGTSTRQTWNGQSSGCFSDVEGYVQSYVRNTTSYCASYVPQYQDLDVGDWSYEVDDDECYTLSGYTYYEVYEDGDVDGGSVWDYCDYNYTKVARHEFYACDAWRNVTTRYQRLPE